MADATGETNEPLRVAFDRRIKLEFHGARITSDGGLLAYRELDDAFGLTAMGASALGEGRRGKNIRHQVLGLLRQAVYGRLAGYEDVNDAERLARDPVMRAIVVQLCKGFGLSCFHTRSRRCRGRARNECSHPVFLALCSGTGPLHRRGRLMHMAAFRTRRRRSLGRARWPSSMRRSRRPKRPEIIGSRSSRRNGARARSCRPPGRREGKSFRTFGSRPSPRSKAVPLTIVASSTLQQSTHGRRRHARTWVVSRGWWELNGVVPAGHGWSAQAARSSTTGGWARLCQPSTLRRVI